METKTRTSVNGGIEKENYFMIDPSLIIVEDGFNVRQDFGDIEELMHSIVENGMKRPLHGYQKDGKYVLTDGERRYRAVMLAREKGKKIEKVPLMLEPKALNQEDRTLGMMIYNDGKPLTMLEQGEIIRRLMNYGWKMTDVVKRTGKGRGYLENLVMLTKAPMVVQNYIREDKISSHAVIQIMQALRKADPEQVVAEVEEAIKNAEAQGKKKATPKHVSEKKVKKAGFGSFYKWVDELANTLTERKDVNNSKRKVVLDLIAAFEDKRPVKKFIDEYFAEKKGKK